MAILIKNARVFAPKDLGVVDVLMANERILAVGKDLAPNLPDLQTVEAGGMIMTPGFFDQHIHVTGGGGEGGPATRTPELVLSELVACGTTDVVGVSGTDYTTRSIPNLLAKVRALQAEGVSAWMYTSNYRCPPTLLTDSIGNDLFFIPEVLGVKIALGDHRSSFPDVQTVLSMLADIRVGAMLAGKIGFLHIHNGNIPGAFAMYEEIVSRGFPVKHIRPTAAASATSSTPPSSSPSRAAGSTSRRAPPAASTILPKPSSRRSPRASTRRTSRSRPTVTVPCPASTTRAKWSASAWAAWTETSRKPSVSSAITTCRSNRPSRSRPRTSPAPSASRATASSRRAPAPTPASSPRTSSSRASSPAAAK